MRSSFATKISSEAGRRDGELSLLHPLILWDVGKDPSTSSEKPGDVNLLYRRMIGSLLYLASHPRLHLAAVLRMLAWHAEQPSEKHVMAFFYLMKYSSSTYSRSLNLTPRVRNLRCTHIENNSDEKSWPGGRSPSVIAILYGSAVVFYQSCMLMRASLSRPEVNYATLFKGEKTIAWLFRLIVRTGTQRHAAELGKAIEKQSDGQHVILLKIIDAINMSGFITITFRRCLRKDA